MRGIVHVGIRHLRLKEQIRFFAIDEQFQARMLDNFYVHFHFHSGDSSEKRVKMENSEFDF